MLFQQRVSHPGFKDATLKVTDWDALGYYMYLPGLVIYNDISRLSWYPAIEEKYQMAGGNLYQANRQENGKYVFKYLGGVAILQAPFFLLAHTIARKLGYPADGFSQPYQYAVASGILFWCIISLFLLQWLLRRYFSDRITAISLLLLCLATNFIQYTAVDAGMSHGWIFALYVFVLTTTYKWHKSPRLLWAALTGYIIGLATISRPTEAVMLFIPLLWHTHSKEAARQKWQMVRQHYVHLIAAIICGFIGILPQLLYWKSVTGSFIYDVGSSWRFLSPYFRVLTGWEKGWFLYTPVTILFVAGLFFVRTYPFCKSVIWFCLINIYIVISWADWKYGGGYSTRALVQSYPVFALPLAAIVQYIETKKWKHVFYTLGIYLVFVNLFQLKQYEKTILHAVDMNRRYYSRIYLNPNPTPLDMSLLDHDEWLSSEKDYKKTTIYNNSSAKTIQFSVGGKGLITEVPFTASGKDCWLKIRALVKSTNGFYSTRLGVRINHINNSKHAQVRLARPLAKDGMLNRYELYLYIPHSITSGTCHISLDGAADYNGIIGKLEVIMLEK